MNGSIHIPWTFDAKGLKGLRLSNVPTNPQPKGVGQLLA